MVSHLQIGFRLEKQLSFKVGCPGNLLQRPAPRYAAYRQPDSS